MTLGELRMVLSKEYPGVDLDVLDGWIQDRYREILDRVPWERLRVQSLVSLTAKYETGTVAVTNGATAITGTGTVWTSGMTGRMIRFGGDGDWYQFTYVSGTTGTLDRAYIGTTAAAASFKITQSVYALPSDVRHIESVGLLSPERELAKKSVDDINDSDLNRNVYGTPQVWAPYMDSQTNPPGTQIEVWPVPEAAGTLSCWYTYDPAAPTSASTVILPWVRTDAIKAGVGANATKDQAREMRFERIVAQMVAVESRRKGGTAIKMASRMTNHRVQRYMR